MKLGVLICQYNELNYVEQCLKPWIETKTNSNIVICVLDGCFLENENNPPNSTDGSDVLLEGYYKEGKIDYFERLPAGLKEHEARNVGLKWLLEQGVDAVLSAGMDELFTSEQITKIIQHVEKEPFVAFFKLQYKNYVFDDHRYVLGFNPHRIWRVKYNNYTLKGFSWDDDTIYSDGTYIIPDYQLPHQVIPGVLINHYTWNDLERSRKKIDYQNKHFSHGAGCGFRYNEKENKIEFNLDYYKKTGQSIPEIFQD